MIEYQLTITEEEKTALFVAFERVQVNGLNEASALVHLAKKVDAAKPLPPTAPGDTD